MLCNSLKLMWAGILADFLFYVAGIELYIFCFVRFYGVCVCVSVWVCVCVSVCVCVCARACLPAYVVYFRIWTRRSSTCARQRVKAGPMHSCSWEFCPSVSCFTTSHLSLTLSLSFMAVYALMVYVSTCTMYTNVYKYECMGHCLHVWVPQEMQSTDCTCISKCGYDQRLLITTNF